MHGQHFLQALVSKAAPACFVPCSDAHGQSCSAIPAAAWLELLLMQSSANDLCGWLWRSPACGKSFSVRALRLWAFVCACFSLGVMVVMLCLAACSSQVAVICGLCEGHLLAAVLVFGCWCCHVPAAIRVTLSWLLYLVWRSVGQQL
jgi:hypothetical protein